MLSLLKPSLLRLPFFLPHVIQGRDKEAKVLLQRALETVEKFFGPEHPVAVQLRAILGPGGWGGDEGL